MLAIEETVLRFMKQPHGQAAKLLQACARLPADQQRSLLLEADDTIIQQLVSAPMPAGGTVPGTACTGGSTARPGTVLRGAEGRAVCVVGAQLIPESVSHGRSADELKTLVHHLALKSELVDCAETAWRGRF